MPSDFTHIVPPVVTMVKLTEIFLVLYNAKVRLSPLPKRCQRTIADAVRHWLRCGLALHSPLPRVISRARLKLQSVGSRRLRLAELNTGKIAGAMVNPRYVEDNGAANLRLLALGKDYADPYPARLSLTTRAWAEQHRSLLVRFIRAMNTTIDWMLADQWDCALNEIKERGDPA